MMMSKTTLNYRTGSKRFILLHFLDLMVHHRVMVFQIKEDLVDYCTPIIFTGSAQLAAINFGQFKIYAYVPNAPFGMRKAPPTVKSQTNYKDSLSDVTTTATSIMVENEE